MDSVTVCPKVLSKEVSDRQLKLLQTVSRLLDCDNVLVYLSPQEGEEIAVQYFDFGERKF